MKLDYAPASTPQDRRVTRIVLRLVAAGLLLAGLFFGLAETVVFVLACVSGSRREPLAVRVQEAVPLLFIAAGGYAVAVVGYLLDRSQVRRRMAGAPPDGPSD
jgi:hypothetical protein